MTWPARALLVALALGPACTLPPQGGDTLDPSVNVCLNDNAVCGVGGVCRGGLCVASTVPDNLPVRFVLSRSQLSGASNVQPLLLETSSSLDLLAHGGQDGTPAGPTTLALSLPRLTSLEAILYGPDSNAPSTSVRGCSYVHQLSDRTLPMSVLLRPAASMRGLGLSTYASRSSVRLASPLLQASLQAPPATYDLYLVPDPESDCPIPPILLPDLPLGSGQVVVSPFDLTRLPLETLGGQITTGPSVDLSAWTARVVDSVTGLTLSTPGGFVPTTTAGQWSLGSLYQGKVVPLEYYRPLGSLAPLFLVVTPPAGLTAPQMAWDLAGIDPFNRQSISLDLTALSLATVEVELRTERGDGPDAQLASVLLATAPSPGALVGAPTGTLAFFGVGPTPTDADGVVSLSLLPGNYDALGVATGDPTLDLGHRSFTFLPRADGGTLAGFALPLPDRSSLDVPILPPGSDAALPAVPFSVTPSLTADSLVRRLFAAPASTPRPSSGRTDDDGHLRAVADAGQFDLTLRLPIERGFPWLVKAGVTLPLTSPGSLRVSLPVEVYGVVSDPLVTNSLQKPLSGARLQAFVLLPSGVHVQIAEGVVDSSDGYRLLLPSSL